MAAVAFPIAGRTQTSRWSAGRSVGGLLRRAPSGPGGDASDPVRTSMHEARRPEAEKPPVGSQPQTQVRTDRDSVAGAEQAALAELAARCLAGDGAAWEQLARSQHRRIYGI